MSEYIKITAYDISSDGSSRKINDVLVDKEQAYTSISEKTYKTEISVWRHAETGWALFENSKIVDIEVDDYSGKAYKSQSANGFIYIPVTEKEKLN